MFSICLLCLFVFKMFLKISLFILKSYIVGEREIVHLLVTSHVASLSPSPSVINKTKILKGHSLMQEGSLCLGC